MLQAWKDLRPLMRHPRRTIVLLSLCASIVGLSEAAVLVLVVRAALAVADGSSSRSELVSGGGVSLGFDGLLAVAVALTLVSVVLHAVVAWFSAAISSEVLQSVRARALRAYFDAPWAVQAGDREGALQDSVSTLAIESSHLGLTFATGVAAILNLTALLAVAAFVDPVAMSGVVGFGAVLFAAMRPVTRLSRNRARLYVDSNSQFAEEAAAASSLAMDLRVFGVEARARERLETMNDTTANRQLRSRFVGRFGSTLYRDLAALFLVTAVGALQWYSGSVTAIGTVVLLVVRALASAQQVHSARQSLAEQRPSFEAFAERMRLLESRRHDVGDRALDAITSVDIQSVRYSYADGRIGLDGVSLDLARGEVVGIVGPSGSGKSTLVQVLLRLRPPTEGRVLVNGADYRTYRPEDWARAVSVVAQEPRLMEGSVADNIRFLRSGYTLEQVEEAAKLAHVDAAIRGLDDGYESWLGPRGGGLSGGQKQRVAIARALLGQPGLLVLDEPTSALDVQSEVLMKQTIVELKGQITMVIVAHRLTTLEACDRIVVMKDGRVESMGTPDELAQRPGFYRSVTAALEP